MTNRLLIAFRAVVYNDLDSPSLGVRGFSGNR